MGSARGTRLAFAAIACAAAAAPCALAPAWAAPGGPAPASDGPEPSASLELFYNGTMIDHSPYDYAVTLVASPVPIALEVRYGHWEKGEGGVPAFRELAAPVAGPGGAPEISMDVDWWRVSGAVYPDPAPPYLVDYGDGTALLGVDRVHPADGRIRIAAGDAHGAFSISVIPRLPAGYGSTDGPAQPPIRIASQARLPICADVAHGASGMAAGADPHGLGGLDGLSRADPLSGVPPIEGTAHQGGFYEVPVGEPEPVWGPPSWDCSAWASFGTQAPQLLRLCEVPGRDRSHHYAWHTPGPPRPGRQR